MAAMPETEKLPLIVGFIADLIFQAKVEVAAEKLGFQVRWIESAEQLAPGEAEVARKQLGEALEGAGAVLIDQLTTWRPALLIFDLGNQGVPWRHWVALLKTSAATRRLPVLCYGPHVNSEALQAAQAAGANSVVTRSRLVDNLPSLIQQYASTPDSTAIVESCQADLSPLARRGLELFNQGQYFEAHEELELAWKEDQTAGRELYRAILQVAVAYLQIERQNYSGAIKMFWRVRQWIEPLPERCRGVDVDGLRQDMTLAYQALIGLGKERIAEFDRRLMKPVRFV
jgi:hypothetical protein